MEYNDSQILDSSKIEFMANEYLTALKKQGYQFVNNNFKVSDTNSSVASSAKINDFCSNLQYVLYLVKEISTMTNKTSYLQLAEIYKRLNRNFNLIKKNYGPHCRTHTFVFKNKNFDLMIKSATNFSTSLQDKTAELLACNENFDKTLLLGTHKQISALINFLLKLHSDQNKQRSPFSLFFN
ncbi:MAG: hypothetical protein RR400_02475 [Clostridia bacterium]